MKLNELKNKLKIISNKGYIPTLRKGDTGVGQTLEQELGLTENNDSAPDLGSLGELKARRSKQKSLTSLVSINKCIEWGRRCGCLSDAITYFGKERSDGELGLSLTLNFKGKTEIENKERGFIAKIWGNKIRFYGTGQWMPPIYFFSINLNKAYELYKNKFESGLISVEDTMGTGVHEKFHYKNAYRYSSLNVQRLVNLVKSGIIKIDFRCRTQNGGYGVRDHGTSFRIDPKYFGYLYENTENLLSA